MKVLVAVKRVVDYKALIRIKADGSGVETANVKMSMNPFDEIAIEEALRLKEKDIASEVIAVSIGQETSQETLRTALALGADRAILIKTPQELSPLKVARVLKSIALQENVQLILLGKQAIDNDHNQVGQMLAGLLNWPQGTFASQLSFHDQGVSVTREVDGGLETLFLTLPAVITTDLRLNEPRYISLPNIVKAKQKPLSIIENCHPEQSTCHPEQNNCHPERSEGSLKTLKVTAPEKRRAGIKVASANELVKILKEKQVIS